MRKSIALALALLALCSLVPIAADAAGYHSQILGRCQKCCHYIYSYYKPVECLNGCYEWRWVTDHHHHCRAAYLGPKKRDIFYSHWFNPANKKRPRNY